MWTLSQNSRPPHPVSLKPVSGSFKEKFKIYTTSPYKSKIPNSEETRRLPVKAYNIRHVTNFRPHHTNSFSPIKKQNKDMSPTAMTPLNMTGCKERESNILPITREIDSDSDNEIDKDFQRTLGIKEDRVVVPGERGRTTQVSWGMKELMLDPKAKVSKGTHNIDWAQEYQNGNSKFKRSWTSNGLPKENSDMIIEEENYRKAVVECLDQYGMGEADYPKPEDVSPVYSQASCEAKRLRPRTVLEREDSPSIIAKTGDLVVVLPKKPSHSPTCLNVTLDWNAYEAVERQSVGKLTEDENIIPSSRAREVKGDEKAYNKYRQLKESLKIGTFTKIQRYQYDSKMRTMVPSESPDKRSPGVLGTEENYNRSSAVFNRREETLLHPMIKDNFTIEKIIGQGSYAIVRQVVDKRSGITYAMKSYTKVKLNDAHRKESVKKEIEILKSLDHPNIIKLQQTIDTPGQLHLVLEHGGNISLHSYLKAKPQKRLTEPEAKTIFKQLVEGLDYIHKNSIVHRDLKLENILLDSENNNVKIIDFGFSAETQKNKPMNVFCGTPSYMAPELVTRKYYFGHLVDIWALGISLYVLLCGYFPFKGITNKDLYNKIMRGQYQVPDHLSSEAKALIRKMLRMNPHERPSASELLKDQWLTGEIEPQSNLKDFLSSKIEEYRNLQKNPVENSIVE